MAGRYNGLTTSIGSNAKGVGDTDRAWEKSYAALNARASKDLKSQKQPSGSSDCSVCLMLSLHELSFMPQVSLAVYVLYGSQISNLEGELPRFLSTSIILSSIVPFVLIMLVDSCPGDFISAPQSGRGIIQ